MLQTAKRERRVRSEKKKLLQKLQEEKDLLEEATESFLLAEKKLHAVKANVEVSEIDGTLRDPKVVHAVLVAADAAVRAAKRKLQGITAAATNNAMPSSPSYRHRHHSMLCPCLPLPPLRPAAAAVEDPRVPNARAVLFRAVAARVELEDATEREKTRLCATASPP